MPILVALFMLVVHLYVVAFCAVPLVHALGPYFTTRLQHLSSRHDAIKADLFILGVPLAGFVLCEWMIYLNGGPTLIFAAAVAVVIAVMLNLYWHYKAQVHPQGMTNFEIVTETAFGLVFGAAALYMLYGQLV
ncbi:MAG TPA: hypothetical protein VK694_03815 [Verrucomicrobiae bacterium]|nr:hypothetical protein [Verrucomicrobiae bacterium]